MRNLKAVFSEGSAFENYKFIIDEDLEELEEDNEELEEKDFEEDEI